MVLLGFLQISIAFICFLSFRFLINKNTKHKQPINWPFLGMLPGLVHNLHHVYDWSTGVLEANNLTYPFKGPWFSGIDMLITVDPANIHYIMSSNFANFPKGSEFKEIFHVLGDGIFNADADLWKSLRTSAHAMISHLEFHRFVASITRNKVEKGLVPVLDHFAETKMVVDLEDVFQRFTFDTTCILIMGYDPRSLWIDFPDLEFAKALDDAEEAIFYRHIKPKTFWKMQGWFGLGEEKRMRDAVSTLDRELAKFLSIKREDTNRKSKSREGKGEDVDLLTSYMNLNKEDCRFFNPDDDKFLKDTILNFMLAGRDTTSTALTWFFWLLSKNSEALKKIRQEIKSNPPKTENQRLFEPADVKNMVYLHGAVCEALRLYPPVPFQFKSPSKPDSLPSGHHLKANAKVLFSLYGLARMRSIWGEDALEFKPERWISEKGRVKHEPSYKFLSFNAGPRTCLGKEIAFAQMKMVAVEMIHNYDVEVVKGHPVEPSKSIILHTKHGVKVTVSKRCLE